MPLELPCKECLVLARCRTRIQNGCKLPMFVSSYTFNRVLVSYCPDLMKYLNKTGWATYYMAVNFFSYPYGETDIE